MARIGGVQFEPTRKVNNDMGDCFLGGNTRKSIIATIVIDTVEQAMQLSETLLDCGIRSLEVTLRTPCAINAIERIARRFPEITVGAGTVLTPDQLHDVRQAGATFAVAPGLNPRVVHAAREMNFPFAPGVCTPSEVERAIELGCRTLKFFPAETSGGIRYLTSMASPYMHLGIAFIPLGGIDENNFMDYLREDCVAAVGGSWLAPQKIIRSQNWAEVRNRCLAAQSKLSYKTTRRPIVMEGIGSTLEREKNEMLSDLR